jgi:hypothetical protein
MRGCRKNINEQDKINRIIIPILKDKEYENIL